MKLAELQMLYRDALTDSAPALETSDLTRLATDEMESSERSLRLASVLTDARATAALRVGLAVQPLAAELAREMAQADWVLQHAKKSRPAQRPAWAPLAMAASVSLFAFGAWWATSHAPSTLPSAAPSASAPSMPSGERPLFDASFEADTAVATQQQSDSDQTDDRVFHDDFGS